MPFKQSPIRSQGELTLLIADHVPAMLAYWDANLLCRFANDAYVDWFGKTKKQMINNMHLNELLGPLFKKNMPYIQGALSGKKQVFEREIPKPDGTGIRHSLATYIPDVKNGAVMGFFAHVADVTHIKELEEEITHVRKEMLRKIIETKETDKRTLVNILRENINQKLVACKLIIKSAQLKQSDTHLMEDVDVYISETIRELNLICAHLTPDGIDMWGLIEALKIHMAELSRASNKMIEFTSIDTNIEKIKPADKLLVYRIIENLIQLALYADSVNNIGISLVYDAPDVKIKMTTNNKISIDKRLKEYNSMVCRVDYYSGVITESASSNDIYIQFNLECF